jgi:hypothetical protein
MCYLQRFGWLALGALLGGALAYYRGPVDSALAGNDRQEDCVLCTGSVMIDPKTTVDAIWVLDYRAGKLLGSVVDRNLGKVVSWAEVDLAQEFSIGPKQSPHFMMTTGTMFRGQTPLYLAETTTGQLGVYTLTPGPAGSSVVRRIDASRFR